MTHDLHDLLERHGLRRRARPLDRLLRWYAPVDELLRRAPDDDEALVDFVMGEELRSPLFKLEGLYRLYAGRYENPLGKLLKRVKALEDLLGLVDYATAMHAAALENGFPDEMLTLYDRGQRGARGALVEELRRRGWVDAERPARIVGRHLERLLAVDWDDEASDRRFVSKALARSQRAIMEEQYDLGDLEAGIHELRRDLRWLPIMLMALGDVAVISDEGCPVPEYESLLQSPWADSPFARLPEEDLIAEPLRIPRCLYLANTRAIAELGDLKDRGQVIESLVAVCRAVKLQPSRKRAHAWVLERLGLPEHTLEELIAAGRHLHDDLREHGLVKELRRALRGR